ncbi:TPA: hypothetical protein DDZ86_02940 [Candidatus Dependentiae bacterium]|nr:hypothetical protein [Candidatus Dependentiae bacterium]
MPIKTLKIFLMKINSLFGQFTTNLSKHYMNLIFFARVAVGGETLSLRCDFSVFLVRGIV